MKPNEQFIHGLKRAAARNGQRVLAVEPGARVRSRSILFGIAVKLKHDTTGVETNLLIPSHYVPRDRSKYKPHQGEQETYRRANGGWARHRRLGEFYGLSHPSDGAPHTKRSVFP